MKFFTTICALSAVAAASEQATKVEIEKRQAAQSIPLSIALVLYTALPSSLLAIAETNQAAVSTVIASEFAAGTIPSWFAALPTDVQTYIVPASVLAQVTSAPSNLTSAAGPVATGHKHTSSAISSAGTAIGGIVGNNGTASMNGTGIASNGTLISNSTVVATQASNGSFVTASGNYSRSSSAMRTGVMMSTSSMAMTTTAGALGSATSAAASATSSVAGGSGAGGLEVPTGLLGVGLAGLVGLVGVFAL